MVRFSAKVVSIQPANRPDGSCAIMIVLGMHIVMNNAGDNKHVQTLHIQLPGMSGQPAFEQRLILFLTEEEWEQLEFKPTYGDMFEFESVRNGFKLAKGVK